MRKTISKPNLQKAMTKNLKRHCERAASRYRERKEKPKSASTQMPEKKPEARLQRAAYKIVTGFGAKATLECLRDVIPRRCAPSGKLAKITAAWVLTLIYSQLGSVTKSVRNRIRLQAYALDYASELDVPPNHLIGFIYQKGGLKGIEKIYVSKSRKARTTESSTKRRH